MVLQTRWRSSTRTPMVTRTMLEEEVIQMARHSMVGVGISSTMTYCGLRCAAEKPGCNLGTDVGGCERRETKSLSVERCDIFLSVLVQCHWGHVVSRCSDVTPLGALVPFLKREKTPVVPLSLLSNLRGEVAFAFPFDVLMFYSGRYGYSHGGPYSRWRRQRTWGSWRGTQEEEWACPECNCRNGYARSTVSRGHHRRQCEIRLRATSTNQAGEDRLEVAIVVHGFEGYKRMSNNGAMRRMVRSTVRLHHDINKSFHMQSRRMQVHKLRSWEPGPYWAWVATTKLVDWECGEALEPSQK